ncbi:MAG TPA: hypothetical protein DCZ92_14625 [Elusimicrobia bacterium]|nr:hypothetical protein [Elusimicrobiota bacterium]
MGITKMIKTIRRNKNTASGTATAAETGARAALDYPKQGEEICAPQYTFRAGAVGAVERVELSINRGPWQACRYSVGYWWYDWAGYSSGRYQAEVKARLKSGGMVASGPVKFQVILGTDGKP